MLPAMQYILIPGAGSHGAAEALHQAHHHLPGVGKKLQYQLRDIAM
jgi:hypothetical protein